MRQQPLRRWRPGRCTERGPQWCLPRSGVCSAPAGSGWAQAPPAAPPQGPTVAGPPVAGPPVDDPAQHVLFARTYGVCVCLKRMQHPAELTTEAPTSRGVLTPMNRAGRQARLLPTRPPHATNKQKESRNPRPETGAPPCGPPARRAPGGGSRQRCPPPRGPALGRPSPAPRGAQGAAGRVGWAPSPHLRG
jgi:hypothetical protein